MLWTRLAPAPFTPGHGMRGHDTITVRWEVAVDEGMRFVVKRGQAMTKAAWAHSVHVEAKGLRPGHEYWYRFEVAGHVSPVGRTRTAPAPWSSVAGLTFASVSCQAYDYGFFTSYPHIVEDDPDFVLHLGDYVYEYGMSATAGNRGTPVPQIVQQAPSNLEQWRATHALYKQDPSLQEAHRLLPFVLTWDDHEYFNDYAGGSPDPGRRRSVAGAGGVVPGVLGAPAAAGGGALQVRRVPDLPPAVVRQPAAARHDRRSPVPVRAALRLGRGAGVRGGVRPGDHHARRPAGAVAVRRAVLRNSMERVRQQRDDRAPRPRRRGRRPVVERRLGRLPRRAQPAPQRGRRPRRPNAVFVTGDWHSTFVNHVKQDFDAPDSPVVASEFVGTSVTTNGDGIVYGPYYGPMIAFNPHIKYFDGDRRGYQRHTLTADAWRTDLVMVDRVGTPTSPASVLGSWVVHDGVPGPVPA